jgi:FkbM family methyltransferase
MKDPMGLKSYVRNRCPRLYGVLRKAYRFPTDYWKPDPGAILPILERFCAERRGPVRFIQIGANNGDDEFTALRQRYDWSGVMVEPQAAVFDELVRRNQKSGMAFEQVAIAEREGEMTLYKVSFSNADWATTLASFDKGIIEKHIRDGWISRCAADEGVAVPDRAEDYYNAESVRCTTLKKLVEKHRVDALDVLLVDAEGHDHEIVKQIEELEFPPRLVVFEHKHLAPPVFKDCVRRLRARGYRLYADNANTIAVTVPDRQTGAGA